MEIFKYILPAFIVMMTAYLLFDKMLSSEEKKRKHELATKKQSAITPIRLRAYERIMLLLERTNPGMVILNVLKPGMSCLEFQTALIQAVRSEFEHNYAQQIYVSEELWRAVSATQENIIKLINTTATHFKPDEPATIMAESIIRVYSEIDENPTQVAIDILKTETQNQFFV